MNPRSRNRSDLFRTSALLFPPDFHTLVQSAAAAAARNSGAAAAMCGIT